MTVEAITEGLFLPGALWAGAKPSANKVQQLTAPLPPEMPVPPALAVAASCQSEGC